VNAGDGLSTASYVLLLLLLLLLLCCERRELALTCTL
jgi:hypothetical protein